MRIATLVLVTAIALAPAGALAGQRVGSKATKVGQSLTASYDRFDDETTVRSRRLQLYSSEKAMIATSLEMIVIFHCRGDSLARPDTLCFGFTRSGRDWAYLGAGEHDLVFLVGSERVPIEPVFHSGDVCVGGVSETMVTLIPTDLALAILRSHGVGRLGHTEFVLSHPKTGPALDAIAAAIDSLR